MKSINTLEGISDGRKYTINDMVKADAGGCIGCSACCHGVGELVALTPYDVYEMVMHLKIGFDELLDGKVQLITENKITIPHLKMEGDSERCAFLNDEDRCSIHSHRPNICRLFPLGRVYEDDDFKYFLQEGACVKSKLSKVKVKKWIGIRNYSENKAFMLEWYRFLKALTFRMKFIYDEAQVDVMNKYLLDTFYDMDLKAGEDFYGVFYERLPKAKDQLGII